MPINNPRYDGSDSGPIDLTKEIRSHYFGRNVIDKILSQTGCTGIRIFYALNDAGQKELIIAGVDNTGAGMLPNASGGGNTLADFSFPCPPICHEGDL